MSRFIDITGQQFNRWTVLAHAEPDKWGSAQWLCRCSCKARTEQLVLGKHLKSNHSQSCGCILREQEHGWRFRDLVGQKFNRWEVLAYAGKDAHGQSRWLCRCSCEARTERIVAGCHLKSKTKGSASQSCGCILREREHPSNWIDLIGKKFGRWEVFAYIGTRSGQTMWKCRCSCKKRTEKIVGGADLRNNKSKSCGCIVGEQEHSPKWIDRTGKRWGRLKYIEPLNTKTSNYNMFWVTQCVCGNYKIAIWGGGTKSCGCLLSKEMRSGYGTEGQKTQIKAKILSSVAPCFKTKNQLMEFIKKLEDD
jgi:hypothetical protein